MTAEILLLTALVLITLGYRIRYRREWHLITGFKLEGVRDPEGLGRWVGGLGILLGALTLAAALVAFRRPDLHASLGPAYAAVVCWGAGLGAVGALRFIL
jgi:hypothetical protein